MLLSNLLSPTFFGCGVTLALLLMNRKLPNEAYYSNIAFFPLGLYPLGYWWKKVSADHIRQSCLPSMAPSSHPR